MVCDPENLQQKKARVSKPPITSLPSYLCLLLYCFAKYSSNVFDVFEWMIFKKRRESSHIYPSTSLCSSMKLSVIEEEWWYTRTQAQMQSKLEVVSRFLLLHACNLRCHGPCADGSLTCTGHLPLSMPVTSSRCSLTFPRGTRWKLQWCVGWFNTFCIQADPISCSCECGAYLLEEEGDFRRVLP